MRHQKRHAADATGERQIAEGSTSRAAARVANSEDAIRHRAYHLWEASGRPPGDGVEFWLLAERELGGPERGRPGGQAGGRDW